MSSKSFQNASTLNNFGPSDSFEQIPEYPQTFKAQATRIEPGAGSIQTKTEGSSSSYSTQTNPVDMTQLWTNAVVSPIGTNWVANKAIQTTVGPASNALIAGLFSETATYNPGVGEAIGIVGMSRALADRTGSVTQFDAWGGWMIGTNNGWRANVAGLEVNATNQYANWLDNTNPVGSYPANFAIGLQIYPDWSTFHNTRAISITPAANYPADPTNQVGWGVGILVSGYVQSGLFIDSNVLWQNPEAKTVAADPVGITFGHLTSRKMAFNLANGDTRFQLNVEGDYLMFRGDYLNWYFAMKDSDKNLYLINNKFRFDTNGRLNVGGNGSIGNATGTGVTVQGDNQHPLAISRSGTALSTAPGANVGVLRWQSGTNAGTLKLVAFAGTSTTGVTVVDNVGAGNS
jgi:hypothetical protein